MKKIGKIDFNKNSDYKTNFTDKFCDNTYNFFIPKIRFKHNKLRELSDELLRLQQEREENYENLKNIIWVERKNAYNAKIIENPYNYEINSFFNEFNNKCDYINKNFLNFQRNFTIKNNEDPFFKDFLNTNKIIKMDDFKTENDYKQQNIFHKFFFEENNFQENQLNEILNPNQYKYKDLTKTNYLYVETYENWTVIEYFFTLDNARRY